MSDKQSFDIDGDGKVTREEFDIFQKKINTQRRLADVSMAAVVIFTALLLSPLISVERVKALSDVFSMFYITMGGVIAAFYGVAAWMGRK